jgi:hypothetical protein
LELISRLGCKVIDQFPEIARVPSSLFPQLTSHSVRTFTGGSKAGRRIFPLISTPPGDIFVGVIAMVLTDDDDVTYSIDSLLNELQTFVSDHECHWYMLSRWQAMLLLSEITSLVDDLEK